LIDIKFFLLVNEERISEAFAHQFADLKHADLKVSRVWTTKELFRDFLGIQLRWLGKKTL
jgi:hypothetical protein